MKPTPIYNHIDEKLSPQGRAEPGVFVIPTMLPLGEWERVAVPAQERLMGLIRNSEDR